VVIEDQRFALHLVPSGTLHPSKTGVLCPGVALDAKVLLEEIDELAVRGISVGDRLQISTRCHLVMPYHRLEDQLNERSLTSRDKIGTTARGIGPCYADKMQRSTAIRFCDLFAADEFRQRLRRIVERKSAIFAALYDHDEHLDAEVIADEYLGYAERLRPLACDTTSFLQDCLCQRRKLLFEGAHGTLLDIDHGTYPYVTSSSSSALGVACGAGVPASAVRTHIGVVKAYTTRVGQGPFPTELHDEIGVRIREQGREFGTTTGRPRRCGWFDAVAGRYGVQMGGIDHIAVMHLDTLSGFDELRICSAYRVDGNPSSLFPAEIDVLERVEPVYETLPGWQEDIRTARRFADLPAAARNYILALQELIGAPVAIVSVGPERSQTIFMTESHA
jgi:adenylosuccinate synthase